MHLLDRVVQYDWIGQVKRLAKPIRISSLAAKQQNAMNIADLCGEPTVDFG